MSALAKALLCVVLTLTARPGTAAELFAYPQGTTPQALELSDLAGRVHRLEDYRGDVVLINFWASWCGPCLAEMPAMLRLQNQLGDHGFRILAVNFKESKSKVWRFYQTLGLDFVTLLDTDGEISDEWSVELLPTSFLLDAAGRLRYRVRGTLQWDDTRTRALIDSLLTEQTLNTAAVQPSP